MVDMIWQVQEAKQRFSEVVRRANSEGPQMVTKHGEQIAVVLGVADYDRLVGRSYDSFNAALLSMPKVDDTDVFDRRSSGPLRGTEQLGWA